MELTKELAFEIYKMGIDHGQLMMEEERDSEDWSNAVRGVAPDMKFSMPLPTEVRREPHSEKWRNGHHLIDSFRCLHKYTNKIWN